MRKAKVALVACPTYDDTTVSKAVRDGLELLGGLAAFIRPGEKIVLKPNVLIGGDPDKCVTTHPAVFRAVGRALLEAGAAVTCGDSSGFGRCAANMKRAGLKEAADALGIPLADFDKGRAVSHRDGLISKQFVIANGVLEASGIVSLPKLKAHGLTRMTGAVKNQFGCIPGLLKGQQHVKMADPYQFAAMLVDLNTLLRPRLFIMDAVMAMEGNGPRSGRPRRVGVLLFSSDPVALDAVAGRLINLPPACVPTAAAGEKAGLGTWRAGEIEVVGGDVKDYTVPDFDVVRQPPDPAACGRLRTFLRNRTCARPVMDKARCTSCGTCVTVCPTRPKAVDWPTGRKADPPAFDYDRCIRCFCCQELCPEGAISIAEPVLGKVIFRR